MFYCPYIGIDDTSVVAILSEDITSYFPGFTIATILVSPKPI